MHDGDFSVPSQSRDGRFWVVTYLVDNGPASDYLYGRKLKSGRLLFVSRPELEKYTLAKMQPITYKAADGLTRLPQPCANKAKAVEYIVFPGEGHGFARPENSRRFNAAAEAFLAKYLGGRFEPAGSTEAIDAFLK